jgi:hypothetical protein
MTLLFTLFLIPASVRADDPAIKKQLVGSWQMPGAPASSMGAIKIPAVGPKTMVLKEDGVMTDSSMPSAGSDAPPIASWTQKWDVHDGVFHTFFVDKDGQQQKENFFKIISLTKTKLIIQDMYHGRGTGTWTRITAKR